jgi:fructose-1,6-bisphosphatase I
MISMSVTLDQMLNAWRAANDGDMRRAAVADTITALAKSALKVRDTVGQGALGAAFAEHRGVSTGGDIQHDLDVYADELFLDVLRNAPVAVYASEELDAPVLLNAEAPLALAIDPLDGSSNIEVNLSIGTIFSILPIVEGGVADPLINFLQPGRSQLAAGFFIYGPQLSLVLTVGDGTHIFTWSARNNAFVRIHEHCTIAPKTQEFAINAANYRHWDEEVRLYVDDCLKGADGPREKDFNMRWVASLVAEAYRILVRGGVFIYPGDHRKGYGRGRLRLVYEANPMAMIIEQAGGSATDTAEPILDLIPTALHQRTPLAFGAAREVMWVGRYHTDPSAIGARSPLFGQRGLFRA